MQLHKNDIFAGRYRLEERLGAGGFGEVWKAFDSVTKQYFAIKIHLKGDGAKAAQEIVKEYTKVMNIHHDNLLTPSHVDIADGNVPYLVMELCEFDLTDRDLTETEVWQLIRDVSAGLKRLTENKRKRTRSDGGVVEVSDPIIHQDIKPANILLRSNGMYAISDFGISKRRLSSLSTNDATQAQDMDSAMSIDYAAPERFPRGKGVAVLASDIWSLGAMLFEIVEGHRPFAECGGDCLNPTIGLAVPTITREGYSDELKQLIYDCLVKNPDARPTAAQLLDYSDKVLRNQQRNKTWLGAKNEPEDEPPMPKPPKPPIPHPNRKWIYVAIAVVAALLAILVVNNLKSNNINTPEVTEMKDFDVQQGKWTGAIEDGKPMGKGVLVYNNDDKDGRAKYEGNMRDGFREDSEAVLTYKNGNTYTGSFVNDQFGNGRLTLKDDGLNFEGDFRNDKPYNGTWYWDDGTVYSKVVNGVEKN